MLKGRISQLLRAICADSEILSIYNFASNRNGLTMTLHLAYFVQRFEDQVSDVVGLLILISSESHI